jgi:hypothetical protein
VILIVCCCDWRQVVHSALERLLVCGCDLRQVLLETVFLDFAFQKTFGIQNHSPGISPFYIESLLPHHKLGMVQPWSYSANSLLEHHVPWNFDFESPNRYVNCISGQRAALSIGTGNISSGQFCNEMPGNSSRFPSTGSNFVVEALLALQKTPTIRW